MAYSETLTSYDVQPVESHDGTLAGVRIVHQRRTQRRAEDGRTLDPGHIEEVNTIEVPWTKLAELIRDLSDWPMYYASGNAARDRRDPVSWPNSITTTKA